MSTISTTKIFQGNIQFTAKTGSNNQQQNLKVWNKEIKIKQIHTSKDTKMDIREVKMSAATTTLVLIVRQLTHKEVERQQTHKVEIFPEIDARDRRNRDGRNRRLDSKVKRKFKPDSEREKEEEEMTTTTTEITISEEEDQHQNNILYKNRYTQP